MLVDLYCSGPAFTNTLVIACEKTRQAAVIDAAAGSIEHVADVVKAQNLMPVMLLLTHSHWDHFADAAKIKARWNLPVYVHPADAPNLRKPGVDGFPLFIDIEPVEPDHDFQDGGVIELGELKIQVIHTPGHSPGGVSLYIPSEHLLISGDTLFKGSIGRLDFPHSEPDKMWASLERLATLPPETQVIPGHGETTTIGDESWLKNAKQHFGES